MNKVEFWRMGASPVPVKETGRLAHQFEKDGWDGLALGEAHGILPDPYAALALAAAETETLLLGSAVAVPLRSSLLTASAMATIHAISGGRGRFCIARGDGAMKVIGRGPVKIKEFEEYLRQVQAFLANREVQLADGTASLARMPVLDSSYNLTKVPLDVAATGPKMIGISARLADGVNFAVGSDLKRLEECVRLAKSARREAGLDPDAIPLGCFVQMAVSSEDPNAARKAIKGLVMTHSRFSGYEGKEIMPGVDKSDHGQIRKTAAALDDTLTRGHQSIASRSGERENEVDFYPDAVDDSFVDRFAIVGAPDYCASRLKEIINLGITRIYIGTRGVGADPEELNTHLIGTRVLPLVREVVE